MAGNELQYSLIAAGVILILALVLYNVLQEHRARKQAEQIFRSQHHDVLLEGEQSEVVPAASGGRMGAAAQSEKAKESATSTTKSSSKTFEPSLPESLQIIDSPVVIEAPAGVVASSFFTAQRALLAEVTKPLQCLGWDQASNRWEPIDAHSSGSINRACLALQLADRHGPIKEPELRYFHTQVQVLCDQFLAVPRLPVKSVSLARANELDKFCTQVDVQICINVVSQVKAFSGKKIRQLLETAGLELRADGCFHAIDTSGNTLFVVANAEPTKLTPELLRHHPIIGLSLLLNVPLVGKPSSAFDRMTELAMSLAKWLEGSCVDDNRMALTDSSIALIREQILKFELYMERENAPAGSVIARRLFS